MLNVRRAAEVVDCVDVADGRMVDDSERSGALGNVGAMFEVCFLLPFRCETIRPLSVGADKIVESLLPSCPRRSTKRSVQWR